MPIPTPFHPRTSAANENQEWRTWSGFLVAGTYEPSHEREYFAIRNAAALIDISPLFKYEVCGPDALRLVNKVMTRDFSRCTAGQIMYSPWCDEKGKIIDDGTIWRLDEDRFMITAADPNLRWLSDGGFGLNARVVDLSAELAALALQGPKARAILSAVSSGIDLEKLGYQQLAKAQVAGLPLTVTRTGYTGDLGYELWIAPDRALELWDGLVEAGQDYGLLPAGMVALDIARIEAGLLLIEVDYVSAQKALIETRKSSPFEAGLGWAVALDKGPFIGRKALAAEKAAGSRWALAGLEMDWPSLESLFAKHDLPPMVAGRASRQGLPVYSETGRQVGQLTSSTFSPILKKYIGLATLETAFSQPGTELQVEITVEFQRLKGRAKVTRLPFFNPERKRS